MYEQMSAPQVLHELNLNPHQKIWVAFMYNELYIRNVKKIFNWRKFELPFKANTNIYKYVRNKHYTTLESNSGRHKRLC